MSSRRFDDRSLSNAALCCTYRILAVFLVSPYITVSTSLSSQLLLPALVPQTGRSTARDDRQGSTSERFNIDLIDLYIKTFLSNDLLNAFLKNILNENHCAIPPKTILMMDGSSVDHLSLLI